MACSSDSTELSIREAAAEEFTLSDTLGVLMDSKLHRDEELERTYDVQINNHQFKALDRPVDIADKQKQLLLSLSDQMTKHQMSDNKAEDYPLANTMDLFTNVVSHLVKKIDEVQDDIETATENLQRKEQNIKCLQEWNSNFEKLKETCLAADKLIASNTYEEEVRITNAMFKEVKQEMQEVVSVVFPDEAEVRDFLASLTSAYFKRGDDIYIDVLPEMAAAANFLFEAGLILYHPYDNNKVRLVHLYSVMHYLHLFYKVAMKPSFFLSYFLS